MKENYMVINNVKYIITEDIEELECGRCQLRDKCFSIDECPCLAELLFDKKNIHLEKA